MDSQKRFFMRQVAPCPGGTIYTIRPGDSFFGLSRRFNVSIGALEAANPGVSPFNLIIGQQICIPVPPAPGACPGGFEYTITPGDTFFSISRRFGIAVQALIAANPGVDFNRLRAGQVVCVPAPRPVPCPSGILYTITAGDTLFSLSRAFGTTVAAILVANPGLDPNRLQIGQTICIPTSAPGPG